MINNIYINQQVFLGNTQNLNDYKIIPGNKEVSLVIPHSPSRSTNSIHYFLLIFTVHPNVTWYHFEARTIKLGLFFFLNYIFMLTYFSEIIQMILFTTSYRIDTRLTFNETPAFSVIFLYQCG